PGHATGRPGFRAPRTTHTGTRPASGPRPGENDHEEGNVMSRRMNRAANRRLGAVVGAGLLSVAVVLAGCAGDNADEDSPAGSSQEHGEHGGMDHPADGGPVPEGMTEATDPAYPVGTEVTLAADHMEGM